MQSFDKNQLSRRARTAIFKRDWQTLASIANALLSQDPEDPENLFLAGVYAKSQRQYEAARDYFGRGVELAPERHDLAVELADQLLRALQHNQSHSLLMSAGSSLARSPYYSDLAATTFIGLGMPHKALPHAQAAYRLQPEVDLFAGNLATCYGFVGETQKAVALYESLLALKPNNRRNHYFLSRLRKAVDHNHIDEMKLTLKSDPQSDARNIFLFFALGKEYEDLELWEESFSWYERGCSAAKSLRPDGLDLELAKLQRGASKPINHRNQVVPESGNAPEFKHIFIVGLPRSGSTLVERALENHSSIQSVGETRYFEHALQRVFGDIERASDAFSSCDPELNFAVAKNYLDAMAFRLGSEPIVIEKLPLNFNFVPIIASAFPTAKFVYTHREPAASCFSMYKQLFGSECLFSYDLEDVARYHVAHSEFREQFAHDLAERWIDISYEDLVSAPKEVITNLLGRLSLPIEEGCFAPEKNASASMTASSTQVRSPIHSGATTAWLNFRPHLEPMLAVLDQKAG